MADFSSEPLEPTLTVSATSAVGTTFLRGSAVVEEALERPEGDRERFFFNFESSRSFSSNAGAAATVGGTGDTRPISLTSRCSRHSWYGVGRFFAGVLVAAIPGEPLLLRLRASLTLAALRLELVLGGGRGGMPSDLKERVTCTVLSTR